MTKPKGGQKPKEKVGSISGKDARTQALIAANTARKLNKGKVKLRINERTEIMVHPEELEDVKKQYGL